MKKCFIFALFLVAPYGTHAAGVLVNEIAWMGSLPKTGETSAQAANNEWIELRNISNTSVDISGWTLKAADGSPEIALSGVIPASGYFLLERTSDDTVAGISADLIYVGALSNSGEHLILRDSSGSLVDEINGLSGWPAGDNLTKDTAQRKENVWVTASSTPKAPTPGIEDQQAQATSTPPVATKSSFYALIEFPSIKAYAGEDKKIVAGSETQFFAQALGLKDEPLENARFVWNFGDGALQEGKTVSHIFQIPGRYLVGLHVSSGSFSVSDYAEVEAIPNKTEITEVVSGSEGFIKISNPLAMQIDIGGWLIESGKERFMVPYLTKIAPSASIALSNHITGLSSPEESYVVMRYPNGSLAFEWRPRKELSVSAEHAEEKITENTSHPAETSLASEMQLPKELAQVSSSTSNIWIFAAAIALSIGSALAFVVFKRWKRTEL